jgi:AraC-like DNA-binding protein
MIPKSKETLGVICTSVGYEEITNGDPRLPIDERHHLPFVGPERTTSDWLLGYLVRGNLSLELNGGHPHTLQSGIITLFPPGSRYRFTPSGEEDILLHHVSFTGKSLEERKICTTIDELGPVTEIGLKSEIIDLFQQLVETSKSYSEDAQRELGATIVLLVARLVNCKHLFLELHSAPSFIEQAKATIRNRLYEKVSMEDIAREMKIPLSTFRRNFTKEEGVSPYQYLLHCKIEQAKKEMLFNTTPLRYIAERFGFNDQYHFSRVFYKVTGTRPSVWRKAQQE